MPHASQNLTLPADGILLLNKPIGPTSHDMVAKIRRLTGQKTVGHAGTLDPFAEGLLIVLVGRDATKRQAEFLGLDKSYEAEFILGATSNTEDPTGEIVLKTDYIRPTIEQINEALAHFTGNFDQMPSAFSAKKIKGQKAYDIARAGGTPELQPKNITIHSLDLIDYAWPTLHIRTSVSSGTYIRALARDIGERLGCGAYVNKLKRTSIGDFKLDGTISI